MSTQASLKKAHVSPRKAGIVAALVRGRTVADALVILEHTPRRSAKLVKKAILSARANAQHNHSYKPDSLVISRINVTAGPRYRRYRPAARGRARRYAIKTSQIKVVVDGEKRAVKKPALKEKKDE